MINLESLNDNIHVYNIVPNCYLLMINRESIDISSN